MKLIGDYHTHTNYSHGRNTIEENVERALELGLKEIAITEHGPGHIFYGVNRKKLMEMKEKISELNEKYRGRINILFGIEANIMDFDGNLDISPEETEKFDFIACGYHNGIMPRGFMMKFFYSPFGNLRKIIKPLDELGVRLATESMIKASYKYKLKFITHPGAKLKIDSVKLAREINQGTILEINNKHGNLNREQLMEIEAAGIRINYIINSDAHSKDAVGNVKRAERELIEAGIDLERVINIEK